MRGPLQWSHSTQELRDSIRGLSIRCLIALPDVGSYIEVSIKQLKTARRSFIVRRVEIDASKPGIWPTALEFETVMLRSGGAGLLRPSSKTSPIAIWEYIQSDDLCGWLCNVTLVENK